MLDRKEVTEVIRDMFNDDLEELITFFTEKVRETKKEKEGEKEEDNGILQKYINRIRRVSCSRKERKRLTKSKNSLLIQRLVC